MKQVHFHKRWGLWLLGICLLTGFPSRAEEYKGKDGFAVVFDGEKLNANFTESDFVSGISSMEPGDTVTFTVHVANRGSRGNDWYMSNEVLESMEDHSLAEGGAYTYYLSWEQGGETTVLYESDQVGGMAGETPSEGLHEAAEGLSDFFWFTHLGQGQEGNVTLKVGLDGESQVNSYQDTLARLKLDFAVDDTGSRPGDPGYDEEKGKDSVTKTNIRGIEKVQTGDVANILLWIGLSLLSLGGLLIVLAKWQPYRKGEHHEEI